MHINNLSSHPPKISVLLPFFNAECYIERAIRSILTQTFNDFELICINDSSQDDSLSIVRRLKQEDKRIRIVNQLKNQGVAYTLNIGLGVAKGYYVARMDADDVAFPNRLSAQKAYLDTHPDIQLVGSQVVGINQHGRKLKLPISLATQPGALAFESLFTAPFAHPSIMARAEVFESFLYSESPKHEYIEDYELWQRMLFAGVKATNIPEPLLAYRLHEKSITINKKGQDKANLFCKASLSQHLGITLNELKVAVVRGKSSYPLREAAALQQDIKRLFFSKYECSTSEKNEINGFETRILCEIAFKNLVQRNRHNAPESIKLLSSTPQNRDYLYSRLYNKYISFISRF